MSHAYFMIYKVMDFVGIVLKKKWETLYLQSNFNKSKMNSIIKLNKKEIKVLKIYNN